jgi:hypothetical protein
MTNRTSERSAGHDARTAAAPANSRPDASPSIRGAAVVAGVALLAMSALAGFAKFVVLDGLVTPGDADRTAADVMASEGMFRLGIAAWYLVIILDVVVAWALFRVFRPVSSRVSMLAAWFRLVFAGVFLVAISELAGAIGLLSDPGYAAVFGADQVHAQAFLRIEMFTQTWDAGLVLFGVHLLLIGYLAYRSGYVPKLLGVLLAVAGLGYAFDGFAAVLVEDVPLTISSFTFIGEFLLAVWLVIWGRRTTLRATRAHEAPVGGAPAADAGPPPALG